MVEFEEIKDEHYAEGDDGFVDEEDSEDEYSDASSEGDDEDDSNIENESFLERITALKDIIPANRRDAIAYAFNKAYSFGSMAAFVGGKAAYIIITSVLLLGIPYAISGDEDRMIAEQERQMQLQQGMSEVTASGFLERI
jgi:mitochondrial import receptor subunit TOM22